MSQRTLNETLNKTLPREGVVLNFFHASDTSWQCSVDSLVFRIKMMPQLLSLVKSCTKIQSLDVHISAFVSILLFQFLGEHSGTPSYTQLLVSKISDYLSSFAHVKQQFCLSLPAPWSFINFILVCVISCCLWSPTMLLVIKACMSQGLHHRHLHPSVEQRWCLGSLNNILSPMDVNWWNIFWSQNLNYCTLSIVHWHHHHHLTVPHFHGCNSEI
jgi:hypothetical protein